MVSGEHAQGVVYPVIIKFIAERQQVGVVVPRGTRAQSRLLAKARPSMYNTLCQLAAFGFVLRPNPPDLKSSLRSLLDVEAPKGSSSPGY